MFVMMEEALSTVVDINFFIEQPSYKLNQQEEKRGFV
jgi:hypothetical protein